MLRDSNTARIHDESGVTLTAEPKLDLDVLVRAVIEAVPGAAFITSADGAIHYSNVAGKKMLAANRARTMSELARASQQEDPAWQVKRLVGASRASALQLLVHRDESERVSTRLNAAVTQWKLSRRQSDVLALVVDGHPNAAIAAILGIATRTVEVHVSALLDRLHVENRSALVARVLAG